MSRREGPGPSSGSRFLFWKKGETTFGGGIYIRDPLLTKNIGRSASQLKISAIDQIIKLKGWHLGYQDGQAFIFDEVCQEI